MTVGHEDLVAYALHQLDAGERERVERALAADEAAAAQLELVRRHLELHDAVPPVAPSSDLFARLRRRLREPEQRPRSLPARFWMPLTAAALVALAFLLPRHQEAVKLRLAHGGVRPAAPGRLRAEGVTRFVLDDRARITYDDGALLRAPRYGPPPPGERGPGAALFVPLVEGRVFVEAQTRRLPGGVRVRGPGFEVRTTGTTFVVHRTAGSLRVAVESGAVVCLVGPGRREALGAGESLEVRGDRARRGAAGTAMRDWFTRATLRAVLEDGQTLQVTLRNDMPDPVVLEPPTGGEAPFYASFDGRTVPLPLSRLEDYPGGTRALQLRPGEEVSFRAHLPEPIARGARLVLSDHRRKLRTEVRGER